MTESKFLMFELVLGYIFLVLRIVTLGAERIFLKFFEKYDSYATASVFFLFSAMFLLPVLFFIPPEDLNLSSTQIITILIVSIGYAIGFYGYVRAIALSDTSLIAPLYNSSLLWLLLLGAIFLGDAVGPLRIAGGVIMFIGVFFLYSGSFTEKIAAIKDSKGSIYMIVASLFLAIGRTVDSYLIVDLQTNAYLYALISNFLIGFYVFLFTLTKPSRSQMKEIITEKPKLLVSGSIVTGWSFVCLLLAFSLLEVTIAEPLTLLSVFVTAILAKVILDEEVKERLPGMIIMVIGSFLLVVS